MIEVSIVIPCRNEEKFIRKCLNSIIEQDYPKENFEVLVVDGSSEDRSKEIVKSFSEKYSFIKLLENPQRYTPFGLNIGIKNSRGEIIARMDAHAGYEKDYISKCVKYLKEYDADNIGGVMKTLPTADTIIAKAIAVCLSHPFGAASDFRLGSKKPKLVDTVFGGCYKREVFEKIGLFNEKLIRSQDIEFNHRLKRAGGKILLVPEIEAQYYPQSTLSGFFKHNFEDGIWTTYPLKFGIRIFSWRHLLPLTLVLGLVGLILLSFFSQTFFLLFLLAIFGYFLISFYFSLEIAKKGKNWRYLFLMPLVFAIRHFGYGLGSIWGLIKILG